MSKDVTLQVFGKNLKEVLDVLELSQSDLAEKTGLTQACISQLVNGEREPSLKTVLAILECVPVKFERLVRVVGP